MHKPAAQYSIQAGAELVCIGQLTALSLAAKSDLRTMGSNRTSMLSGSASLSTGALTPLAVRIDTFRQAIRADQSVLTVCGTAGRAKALADSKQPPAFPEFAWRTATEAGLA